MMTTTQQSLETVMGNASIRILLTMIFSSSAALMEDELSTFEARTHLTIRNRAVNLLEWRGYRPRRCEALRSC